MIKKTLLLAVAAVAAMALAVPALASASWTHEHEPITSQKTVTFAGNAQFVAAGLGAGFNCTNTHADVDLLPGETGEITSFEATEAESKCDPVGLFSTLGCKISSVTSENLPWVVHIINEEKLLITNVKITNHLVPGLCTSIIGTQTIVLEGNVTATPDDPDEVHSVELSGELTSSLGENVTVSGTLNASPSGTYGIR